VTGIRSVFLTGASSGIGEAFARHYAGAGAVLGLVARRSERLAALRAALLASAGAAGRIETYGADVRDAAALQAAAAAFLARHGVPDVVIANAGVSHGTLSEHAEDTAVFEEIVDINLTGIVRTFHPFIGPMRAAGRGTLVGIASVAGVRGLPGAGAYSASKAAAIAYLESLRVELCGTGVSVVTLLPGYIRTPMTDRNPYRMPFLLEADDAVVRMARLIAARRAFAVVPWQMAIVARLMRLLPAGVFDRLAAGSPRKPRRGYL
jgi:short-subunit dehydrogenase